MSKYNVFVKKSIETKQDYKFGCAMLYFDFTEMKSIHDQIDPKDIYTENNGDDFGLEKEPHCTLLYGLHQEVRSAAVKKITDKFSYGQLDLYNISIFENEKYDVLKFNVKGENLKETNRALKKLPFSSDYPDYKPHTTIAYLVKGKGKKYVEKFKNINHTAKSKHILFSHATDKKEQIKINQKKSAVFVKAGFNPNQTRDSDGKWSTKPGPLKDRPCFKEWFEGSKATEPNGEPKKFYHGTTHEFNEFTRERANPENDFGQGFYFSSSIDDVDANYDNIGPDLTNRIEKRVEHLTNNDEMDAFEALQQASSELAGKENRIIPVYLSVKNPVVIGAPVFHADERETAFTVDWDEENERESGTLVDFIDTLYDVAQDYGKWSDIDTTQINNDIWMQQSGQGQLYASELVRVLKSSQGLMYGANDDGDLIGHEVIRETFERMGFDGIIDNTVWEKFGQVRRIGRPMPGIYEDTQHIIAFESGQIKRTDAKSFCHETDIRKSGAVLIDHKAGFKEDQARDRSGKWTDKWAGMRKFENEVKDRKKEKAGIYDKDGNLIETYEGDEDHVGINQVDPKAFLLTHNHPNNSSLSRNDTLFMLSKKFENIRAIGPNGIVYQMVVENSPAIDYAGKHFRQIETDLMTAWEDASKMADKEVVDYVYNKYKNNPDLALNWEFKDAKIKEAQKLFGRYSDRVNWHLANSTELGKKYLKYTVYE